jgi:hypothetical protein
MAEDMMTSLPPDDLMQGTEFLSDSPLHGENAEHDLQNDGWFSFGSVVATVTMGFSMFKMFSL